MKILVVNCGSSSLKYQLIDMDNDEVLASGKCDRIGMKGIEMPFVEYKRNGKKHVKEVDLPDHKAAFEQVLEFLTDKEIGAVKDISEIDAVGHRIANGGPNFKGSVLITPEVLEEYYKCIDYAPLHNPAHIQGINACMKLMPNQPQALVFDTSFHRTIPEEAAVYAIPYEYYEKYAVKRYGAHGISHQYIAKAAAKVLGKKPEEINIISCHLGNGSSLAAIRNGKSVDTSMGLTPLEGLVMGTRSGDIDPAILQFIMKKENIDIDEMTNILNKKSGMLGVSGTTGDMRDLKILRDKGDKRAALALDIFSYRVRKYIGAYMAVLGHVDAIIFEGGIGEHNLDAVAKAVEGLEELGIKLDRTNLDNECYEGIISMPDSRIPMYVIPTNEELEIAKETMELLK